MNLNSKNQKFEIIKTILLLGSVFYLCIEILIFSNASVNGAKKGLLFCADILIPSLFPFMVLSSFIVKSGLAAKLGVIFNPITKFLFNLPGSSGSTILISLIGGYPTGVKGVRELLENNEITQKQAERMLCFAICAGPPFILGVIGIGIFKSFEIGVIILISQVFASIMIGIILGLFSRFNKEEAALNTQRNKKTPPLSETFVLSSISSTGQMINLCAFVVLFSSFIEVINQNGLGEKISSFLMGMGLKSQYAKSLLFASLEVTGGCLNAGKLGVSAEFISFFIAFAGICVHFQLFSTLSGINFSKFKFILFRAIHGTVSALITHFALMLFPVSVGAFSISGSNIEANFYSNTAAGISLILLCIFFLISLLSLGKKQYYQGSLRSKLEYIKNEL